MNRTSAQALGEWGESYVRAAIEELGWPVDHPDRDYGTDLYFWIHGVGFTSTELGLVQVKTRSKPSVKNGLYSVRISSAHIKNWCRMPFPFYLAVVYKTTRSIYLVNIHNFITIMRNQHGWKWPTTQTISVRFPEDAKLTNRRADEVKQDMIHHYRALSAAAQARRSTHGGEAWLATVVTAADPIDRIYDWALDVSRVLYGNSEHAKSIARTFISRARRA